jgi:peptidoglycan L-alanyl-D-glutamate endopeptidase CwlK
MRILKEGDQGDEVKKLQQRLKDLGFNPGEVDGEFGLGTEAAVLAFQKSEGLLAHGIVDEETLTALGFEPEDGTRATIPEVTVAIVTKMFPFTPIDNIKKNLPIVLEALQAAGLIDKNMILMALATIRAESEGFTPINEMPSRFNTSPGGHPFDLYDRRRDLGNQGHPDGERFRGRGFIQLTGRANYQQYGGRLGLNSQLIDTPQLANDPPIAAKLLATFLKDKERAIRAALLADDLGTARRLVNGGTHGLDRFVSAYRIGQQLIV